MRTVRIGLGLVSLLSLALSVSGYSSGAPDNVRPAVCDDMTPGHQSNAPQTSAAPYTIEFTPTNYTTGGSPITVTIKVPAGSAQPAFQGFLLTTQYDSTSSPARPGTFNGTTPLPSGTRLVCSTSAVTHNGANPANRSSLSFQWIPPSSGGGDIRFRATFLENFATFWVQVNATDLLTANSNEPPPTAAPTTPAPSTLPPAPSGKVTRDPDCGSSKGCFSDCKGDTCNFLMTWGPGTSDDNIAVSMSGVVGSSGRYVALGLSNDDKMGGDSVMYCVSGVEGAFLSYNLDGTKASRRLTNPTDGLANMQTSFTEGVLSCSFTRVKAADSTGERFALDKPYTLLYATGPGAAGGVSRHDKTPLVSTQSASLLDFTVDIGGSVDDVLVKTHGSLMIVAWILLASIGLVLARYFKDVWPDSTWCSQKIWFQIHRACMVTAFLATASAFVIIFVEVEGYSEIQGETYKKAHPILGIIVMALTVINPIMALFRPHPGTPNRPYFNWAHWMVGSGAHILGVITIFFGLLLEKAGAPDYVIYIMAAYVGWQVIIQLLLEIAQCLGRRKDRSNAYEMSDVNAESTGPNAQKESMFSKKLLLFLHIFVIIGFTVALIVVLNFGKDEDE